MSDQPRSACPGYCCAAFYWPRTAAWMKQYAEEHTYDGPQIRDMLIPLTPKQARERYERFAGESTQAFSWKHRGHHFTCKNWDEATRLCKIYEDRPTMCRDYPYGQECQHGCGLVGGCSSADRIKMREEQSANQWKAYVAPKSAQELA
jgi:Fe-S-cluster containining protein